MAASFRTGIGATPYPGGVTFRTWAPFATAVAVTGEGNGWAGDTHDLARESGGCWSVDVAGAQPGHQYSFLLATASGEQIRRADPRARVVVNSIGNGIVYAGVEAGDLADGGQVVDAVGDGVDGAGPGVGGVPADDAGDRAVSGRMITLVAWSVAYTTSRPHLKDTAWIRSASGFRGHTLPQ